MRALVARQEHKDVYGSLLFVAQIHAMRCSMARAAKHLGLGGALCPFSALGPIAEGLDVVAGPEELGCTAIGVPLERQAICLTRAIIEAVPTCDVEEGREHGS